MRASPIHDDKIGRVFPYDVHKWNAVLEDLKVRNLINVLLVTKRLRVIGVGIDVDEFTAF